MRMLQFGGVAFGLDDEEKFTWQAVWRIGWDDAPPLSREEQRRRATAWAGTLGAPLRVEPGSAEQEYDELTGSVVTGIEFAPDPEENFYRITYHAVAASGAASALGDRHESIDADGERRIERTWQLSAAGLADFLPEIGDALPWGGEELICTGVDITELSSGLVKVKLSAGEFATRMLGGVQRRSDDRGGELASARFRLRRELYPEWARQHAPGMAADWAGEGYVVKSLVAEAQDRIACTVTLEAQADGAVRQLGGVSHCRERESDPTATAEFLVPVSAYAEFLAAHTPGSAADWAGADYRLRSLKSGAVGAAGIPVTLIAEAGTGESPVTRQEKGDERIRIRVVQCPVADEAAFLAAHTPGAAAPWAGEGFRLTGISSRRLSGTLLEYTLEATELVTGPRGPVARTLDGAGGEVATQRWRCRVEDYDEVASALQPGMAADWAGADFVVTALTSTVRSRFELELTVEAAKVNSGPVGDAELVAAADGSVTESRTYLYPAAAGGDFIASCAVGSVAPWSEQLRVTALRSVSEPGSRLRITVSARDFTLRQLAPPSRELDSDNELTAQVRYLVPEAEYEEFSAGCAIGSEAAWAGADCWLVGFSSKPGGVGAYEVTLTARSLRTGLLDIRCLESFAGLGEDQNPRREVIYRSRWQVRSGDLDSFRELAGSSAQWAPTESIVTRVTPRRISDLLYEVEVEAESVNNPELFRKYSSDDRSNLSTRTEYAARLTDFWLEAAKCGYRRTSDGVWEELPEWDGALECPFSVSERPERNLVDSVLKTVEITETRFYGGGLRNNLSRLVDWGREERVFNGSIGTCSGSFLKVGMKSEEVFDNYGNRWTRAELRYQLAPEGMSWNAGYWAKH